MLEVYLDPCTVNSRAHKSPEYLKINPHATVPCATDGDCTITESNAILQYTADHGGQDRYYPKDLKIRTDVNRWLLWEASVWFPSCYVYLVEYVVKPLLKTSPDEKIIAEQAPRWNQLASVLDQQLAKTKWLAGDEVTIADLAVASPMHLHAAQRLPLEKCPNLKRWIDSVEKLPCWQKTQAAVDKALLPDSVAKTNGSQAAEKVQAIFNYTKDVSSQLTEIYFYDSPAAKSIHEPGDDPQLVTITNGWPRASTFTTDTHGFSIHPFTASHTNWEDDASVRSSFYPEIVTFLKATTGAKRVLVFDHTIRSRRNQEKKLTQEHNTSQRAPVMLVHCDYTSTSGPLRVEQLLGSEASDLLKSRVAFYNVWKPIHRVVEENPLAMCDVTSAPMEDFFTLHLRYRERDGENYVMRYSPGHRWVYFPGMTPQQVVLLKTFDSERDGRARFVGHTAFKDPTSREDAPMRESVEIRTIAFF